MAESTPEKEYYRIDLTPTTKKITCLLCGDKKTQAVDRRKVLIGDEKTELGHLIERLLDISITAKTHSDTCCRNCERRLVTIEKSVNSFKGNYTSTQKQLETSHGKRITKRLASEHQIEPVSKRNLFASDTFEPATANEQEALVDTAEEKCFEKIRKELQVLTSKSTNSILRQNKKEEVENFSFKAVEEEWKQHAPTFHRFIETASTNPTSEKRNIDKKGDALLPAKVSAGCKLLSIYNRDMSAMKYVNDVILSKGGLKTSAFTRMQSTGDCHSYPTVIKKADETAELWDSELRQWQTKCHNDQELEEQIIQQISYISDTIELVQNQQNLDEMKELVLEKAKLGNTLCKFRQKMHPSYYFIGDNCDMVTKVRRMTSKNQHKDEHMFQMCAYLNRISGNDKDNSKPLQNANEANFSQLIPGEEEKQDLLNQFAMLVARKWTVYIPHFRPYETVIPPYIDHGFMKETKKKTERINMGVLKKNECKNEDMVDICKFLHQYVPGHDTDSQSKLSKLLSGGDYLSFERHKQAQMSLKDDENPSLRLEGLVPKMEEFHNQAEFLRVIWKNLYSTKSSRDSGTMYAARNLVNARNVSADPTGNYYASATMMDKFTDAYIIAGALHHFSMDSINDEPKSHCYTGEIGNAEQMRNHLMTEAEQFIASHVDIDIKPLPEYGPSCNTFNCRYCGRTCTGSKKLRKHESTAHNHPDPVYGVAENQASTGTSQISSEKELDAASVSDKIYAYTKHALTVGLLRLNHNDAIALGDGKRIMLVNLYLCMLYKHNSCPKYAFGILETICQSKILLSERMAHRLIWNRVVNHRGDQDTNHPNDLDMEHCNKIFKDQAHSFRGVFTEKTVARVSRSALSAHRVVKNFDRETDTRTASGKHTITDTTSDVQMIVDQLMQQQVYIERQGRKHNSFPNVTANPYDGLDMETVRDWLSKSLKNYAVKSFY